jgi:hypothetical protein
MFPSQDLAQGCQDQHNGKNFIRHKIQQLYTHWKSLGHYCVPLSFTYLTHNNRVL